jgi:NADH-quinone oxidoreductase subunit G
MGVQGIGGGSAASVFLNLAKSAPVFEGVNYQKLAEVEEQWPIVGRSDLYYGGTTYENSQGLGVQLPIRKQSPVLSWPQLGDFKLPKLGLMAFPITRLYDRGNTLLPSELLHQRIGEPYVILSVQDAERMKVRQGDMLRITFSATGGSTVVSARLDESLPERVVLAPRSFGLPVTGPTLVELKAA